jgi:hypothetical protein
MHMQKSHFMVKPGDVNAARDTVELLNEYGVAYLPGFIEDVGDPLQEFERAFADVGVTEPSNLLGSPDVKKNLARELGETKTGIHLKLNSYIRYRDRYSAIARIFGLDYMRDVATGYLGSSHSLNRHLVLTHDYRPAEEILPFHSDEMNSLKFFLYLTYTAPDIAPFE